MTVLVAITEPGKGRTWIGSDTLFVDDYEASYGDPKWIVRDNRALGITGPLRALNIMQQEAQFILQQPGDVNDVAERLRNSLVDGGFKEGFSRGEYGVPVLPMSYLYATPTAIWEIGDSFDITKSPTGHLVAMGSGKEYATGCGYGLLESRTDAPPMEALRICLSAATVHRLDCGGSLWIDCITEEKADEPKSVRQDNGQAWPETIDATTQGQPDAKEEAV